MKNINVNLLAALLIVLFATGCSSTATPLATMQPTSVPLPTSTVKPSSTPLPEPTATLPEPTPEEAILEISGPGGTKMLSMAELQALPVTKGQAGMKSSTGKITIPALYSGVTLQELANLVGGMDESMGINVVAEDGYAMTLSFNQITKGEFIAYDPATGDEKKMDEPLHVILAYAREDQPLPQDSDGKLRLAIISSKNNQVTDGHWAVKWVAKIEVKPLGEEWSLKMAGVIPDEIDRNSYQSCAAPGCHQASWTDDKAQVWDGVPLWLLVGRVDDLIKHDGPAYFETLADAGYTIEIVATDGYTVTLDSVRVKRNNNIVVAYQVNGNPLPDKYFPLRLVGSEVEKSEMVGAIAEINLDIDPALIPEATVAPTPTPTSLPPAANIEADLAISGKIQTPLYLKEADLRAMEVVQLTAEHPKKGQESYEGVRLIALLMQAGVEPEAKTLHLTAVDGYAIDIDLATVQACSDCLLAFTNTPGKFKLVMPGMDSAVWVKDIVSIEVQ
jgi:hypothetical protein